MLGLYRRHGRNLTDDVMVNDSALHLERLGAPLTKQTNLVTLPVVLHEELVPSSDVCVEVPKSVL